MNSAETKLRPIALDCCADCGVVRFDRTVPCHRCNHRFTDAILYIPQQQARQQLLDLAEEFEKRSAASTDGIRGAYIRAAQLCREKADA